MTEPRVTRRPLPALIALLALTLLTALVWWRVLHRDSGHATATSSCRPTQTQSVLPRPSTVNLTVLNGTSRTGLAKTTAAALSKQGFKVNGYANDTKQITGVAEIRFSPDQKDGASLLAFYITHATIVPLPDTESNKLVVSLGKAFKSVTPAAAVSSAMHDAKVSLAPTNGVTAAGSSTC